MAEWRKKLQTGEQTPVPFWVAVLVVTAFISLRWLFNSNVGLFNESNLLVFSRQQVDPTWLPKDWYLNQAAGYRVLFMNAFGRLAMTLGFLPTSIIGRLLCYLFISSGLVFLSRQLRLSLMSLVLALALFLYVNTGTSNAAGDQGIAAREWIIGGLEPKMVAYGLILFGITCLLRDRWCWAVGLFGLAASFHTLVGGWASIACFGWLLLRRRAQVLGDRTRLLQMVGIFLLAACFTFPTVWQQISDPAVRGRFTTSFTYVFIRTPHHLNPLSWHPSWVLKLGILLTILCASVWLIHRQRRQPIKPLAAYQSQIDLADFTLVSLIPFLVGVTLAPFDLEGKFLQYYPFRFGDIMLPLMTCILLCCALEQQLSRGRSRVYYKQVCLFLITLTCCLQAFTTFQDVANLRQFPGKPQTVTMADKDMAGWIRANTPKEAIFVTPPVDFVSFNWLAERATVVNSTDFSGGGRLG